MNKTTRLAIGCVFVVALCTAFCAKAQDTGRQTPRVAILAPLYLDSAFKGDAYKLGNTSIPKYFLPGLDFYNGVMLAADSLQKEHQSLNVTVYDTKKAGETINSLLAGMEQQHYQLVIAAISNNAEQKALSEFAFKNNVPVLSATYPNDAGLSGNPFFIMLNSSLRTHVEALHKYIQKNYAGSKMIYLTRKGPLEDKIKGFFTAKDSTYPHISYKVTELTDNFTPAQLLPLLDSTRQNVLICGSLNEAFGASMLSALCGTSSYKTTVIGMPTWDGMKGVDNDNCKQLEIVYSTPYNYSRSDKTGASLVKQYRAKFVNRPSDMVFKGFESMYHFSRLLLANSGDFINHLSDTTAHIANSFLIEPTRLSSTSFVPDYLENKKLYFVKIQGGVVKKVE